MTLKDRVFRGRWPLAWYMVGRSPVDLGGWTRPLNYRNENRRVLFVLGTYNIGLIQLLDLYSIDGVAMCLVPLCIYRCLVSCVVYS
jgi:hypothetical protein